MDNYVSVIPPMQAWRLLRRLQPISRSKVNGRSMSKAGESRVGDPATAARGFSGPDVETRAWQSRANCMGVDPELFFPERGASTREAKEVCRGCVVRSDCLEYALANGEKFGIWGGLSERERRKVRRSRALARRTTGAATA